ncbi:DUF551 domain-containing protein [Pseudomonas sp. 6D_7.1_Bac1]|uniref:DUF551 domain-containing protein n=1 Tax=Pseudomonas sp. 6D_7.1_Bac1 TaxID=2971615 RepID=UPI0021C96AD2|nr:DUF551 domain-containing protein [Pseudomonas sp. 6D_7.1_Bac1]MCU1752180.1 DUF551 domain-containing protein [Pseudomonas sp. 6D_7.1_Bac1]
MSDWIKCSDLLPACNHECTSDETMVSRTVLVTDCHEAQSLGIAHMRLDRTWKLYGGDYDFMHPTEITHWQPLPAPPAE